MKIVDIIKYEGDNSTFVWKHPAEDFNTFSQLIVHESQEALLFLNGQALDLFGAGRHTLYTENIPLLSKIVNIPTDGESPFHCEVYFINKTEQMAINWGMGNVNFLDPVHNNYAFKIGASGEMSLRVSDSRKIITKLVGTEKSLDQETIKKYFKVPITTHIKTILPNILREKGVSIFEVEAYLSEFSEILKNRISEEMADYGITLEKFWINTILKPETDPFYVTLNRQRGEKVTLVNQGEIDMQKADYQRKVDLIDHTGEVQKRKMDIDAKRYEQEQLGFTYAQERGFDVLEKFAENEGSGADLRNTAMNLGMGLGAGEVFGDVLKNISSSTMMSELNVPPVSGTVHSDSMGTAAETGSRKENPPADQNTSEVNDMAAFKKKLDKLAMMKECGLLSEEEFAEQKKQLLNEIMGA